MNRSRATRRILILGYGEMGHAFETILQKQHQLEVWSRKLEQRGDCQLESQIEKAEIIIFCLPVMAHEPVARRIAQHMPADSICLTIAKGLDEQARPAFRILQDQLPEHIVCTIYGPMIAEELIAKRPGFAQLASSDPAVIDQLMDCFKDSPLYLQAGDDLIGSSWSVILKNVYAILIGISDGLELGDNMRGLLVVESLKELAAIVQEVGGSAQTPYSLAGLGDLVTTSTSQSSHHHQLGLAIGAGLAFELEGEGVHSLAMVQKFNVFNSGKYTLFTLCMNIIQQPDKSRDYFEDYLNMLDKS